MLFNSQILLPEIYAKKVIMDLYKNYSFNNFYNIKNWVQSKYPRIGNWLNKL